MRQLMDKKITLLVFAMILVVSLSFVSAEWNSTYEQDLYTCWSFENSINDSVGNNDLENQGAGYSTGKHGLAGNISVAKYFNSSSIDFQFNGTSDKSLSFWWRASTLSDGQIVLGVSNKWNVYFNSAGAFRVYKISDLGDWAVTTISAGTWVHTIITVNSTSACSYVDGSLYECRTRGITVYDGNDFQIGDNFFGQWGNGLIDDVMWWNRQLEQGEITGLYNNSNGLVCEVTPPPPVYPEWNATFEEDLRTCWNFENDSNDLLSNNDLANIGGAGYSTGKHGGLAGNISVAKYFNTSSIDFQFNGTNDKSLSFWWKASTLSDGQIVMGISNKWNVYFNSAGAYRVYKISDLNDWAVDTISAGTWVHTVVTVNSTSACSYIDGSLFECRTRGATVYDSGDFQIGDNAFGQWGNGLIDDVIWWDRQISEAEVVSLYNSSQGLECGYIPAPTISIVYPLNATYNIDVIELNYTIIGGENCWYSTNLGVTNNTLTCGNNVTGLSASEGSNTWIVWGNNSNGLGSDSTTFIKETIYPINLEIVYPTSSIYSEIVSTLNYTINNSDNCWYSTDLGVTNNTLTCGNNITGLSTQDGLYRWKVWANNSLFFDYDEVNFTVNLTLPEINIVFPLNITYTINVTDLNYTANNTESCLYSLEDMTLPTTSDSSWCSDGSNNCSQGGDGNFSSSTSLCSLSANWIYNYTFSDGLGQGINFTILTNGYAEENDNAHVYCLNTSNDYERIGSALYTLDYLTCHDSHNYKNMTGSIPQSCLLDNNVVSFNISAQGSGGIRISIYDFTFDTENEGVFNNTNGITCGDNVTGLSASEGSNTWGIWANDSSGDTIYELVTFSVNTILPVIVLNIPENATHHNNVQNFTANITDNTGISNATLYVFDKDTGAIVNETTRDLAGNPTIATFGIEVNLSDNTYLWSYKATNLNGLFVISENRTFTIDTDTPVITWDKPYPSETPIITGATYNLGVLVEDEYLDGVNITVYNNAGSITYTNFSGNLTTDTFGINDTIPIGEISNIIQICARDSLSSSPKIEDDSYFTKRNAGETEYILPDGNVVVREIVIKDKDKKKLSAIGVNLVTTEEWVDFGKHYKTTWELDDINDGFLEIVMYDDNGDLELLTDRGITRVVDKGRNYVWDYKDMESFGYDVEYDVKEDGQIEIKVKKGSYVVQDGRWIVDPIVAGLNTICENETIYSDTTAPVGESGGYGGSGTTPTNNTFTKVAPINFTINASDEVGIENYTLIIRNESDDIINETTIDVGGYGFLEIFGGILYTLWYEGVYKFVFTVIDVVGNILTTSEAVITYDITEPSGAIVYPLNTSYDYQITELNYTVVELNPHNCWYSTDLGVTNNSVVCGDNVTGLASLENSNTWYLWINDSVAFINESKVTFVQDTIFPDVFINSPTNNGYYSSLDVTVDISATDDNGIYEVWYYDGVTNTTYTAPLNHTFSEGVITFIAYAEDNIGNVNSSTISFTTDITSPVVVLDVIPNETTNELPINISINYSITDANIDSCWYSSEELALNDTLNCSETTANISANADGYYNLTIFGKDLSGVIVNDTETSYIFYHHYYQEPSENSVAEGEIITFYLYVNMSDVKLTTAFLDYNGIEYRADSFNIIGDFYEFEKEITIPAGTGNSTGNIINWNWKYAIASYVDNQTTTIENQTVFSVEIDDCSTYTDTILNFSLYDEETDSLMNASKNPIIKADITITSLGDNNVYFTYNTSWSNNTGQICVPSTLLNQTSYYLSAVMSYVADDYVEEFWYLDNGYLQLGNDTLNEYTSRNVILRDLITVDSTTFLFTYYNDQYLIVEDGIVILLRNYIEEGLFKEAERGKMDNNGQTHLHLVQEDVIYKFVIMENNSVIYRSADYNAKCLEIPCTITLQDVIEETEFEETFNNLPEGTYDISSDEATREVTLDFNLNQTGVMNLSVYEYSNVEGSQDEIIDSDIAIAKSGSVVVFIPLSYGNQTYYAVVRHNSDFVNSEWIDMTESGYNYFGTLGLFMGAILILTLGLIAVSHGALTIVFLILGLIFASITKLVDLDFYTIGWFVSAGGLIIYKLANRRRL